MMQILPEANRAGLDYRSYPTKRQSHLPPVKFQLQNTGRSELTQGQSFLHLHHLMSNPDLEGSLKVTPLTLALISKRRTVLSRTTAVLQR